MKSNAGLRSNILAHKPSRPTRKMVDMASGIASGIASVTAYDRASTERPA